MPPVHQAGNPLFTVTQSAHLQLIRTRSLKGMYTLSPFVWHGRPGYEMLLRAVNRSEIAAEKVARIYYGRSEDGIRFTMGDHPAIAPGPGDDRDGCEDPTVAIVGGTTYVYYTGWNQTSLRAQLLLAAGPDAEHLQKRGIAIPWSADVANPKEASIAPVADGTWRLFFEYSQGGASRVGIASAPRVDGPWTVQPPIFESRPSRWDAWHLSPGPLLCTDPSHPVMLYNGATRDAKWRIGWIAFDAGFTRVVARGDDPLITPPTGAPGDTDIAFAASAVEESNGVFLYYSIADKDMIRAKIESAHPALEP
jgi:beta-1,2-mannobiose phosphorylase / 1,2-beta-oligomannan phosphorylase